MKVCCTKTTACGHYCNGVRGEARCLPCLTCELDVADDYCSICYVESLADAPCVRLDSCKHVYHYECVKSKIENGYSGARIQFSYLECPADKVVMSHPELRDVLNKHLDFKAEIASLSLARLQYENRMNDPQLSDAANPYYKNPQALALHLFLFFKCFKCKGPYFAGGYQCQGNEAEFNEEDLVCPACQPKPENVRECKEHGKEWLAFKCKYCCEFANFYCWGNTHFCNNCHIPGTWQKLVVKLSGVNKKKLWEYDQCPSLKTQMDKLRNMKLNTEELEERMFKLRCDPKKCPLGRKHPPNGFEFGLGCSMCADKDAEDENVKAIAKSASEKKGKSSNNGNTSVMTATYSSDFDENGILYQIATNRNKSNYTNPMLSNLVRVTSSALSKDSEALHYIVDRKLVRCVTKNSCNSWFIIDFGKYRVRPTHYTLKHYSSWDTEALRSWQLAGSVDGKQTNWDTLIAHQFDNSLNRKGATKTWAIPQDNVKEFYRFFCIIQTGKNSNDNFYLALSGVEFYGQYMKG